MFPFRQCDLLSHPILEGPVFLLLFDQFVKLDRLIELVTSMCLGRFIQGRLFDFVHHFAILRRELVFDLFLKLTSILSILGHFQESLSLEELT